VADLSNFIHSLAGHSAIADTLARFAADDLVYFAIFVVAWLFFRQHSLRPFLAAVTAAVLAVGLAALIGAVYYVPRPFVVEHFTPLIRHAPDASFPSDHLAAMGAVVAAAWMIARRLALATAAASLVVAFARVYVGVHWVTDVAAGFILGLACGVVAWRLYGFADQWAPPFDPLLRKWRLRPETPAGG
jgi:undecaprenyl-diphosphatase